jgi:NADPH:quinone reductase-like Zn-dependent oxidoreductase
MTVANPGFLDTLCFVEDDLVKVDLGPDGKEFDIRAAGVNFKDVTLVLGQLPGNHLGQEGSGVATRVGSQVSTIKPGDRICAISGSTIANFGRCPAECAVVLPDFLSFAEGASIPIVYCTAHHCLAHVARLQPDETILIHAAAGGVGQAAIMLAQAVKARILVTVGSEEKKTYLMQTYHIPEESIFYSRDTSFMQGVLDVTNGRGVDVALNSLAGDQLPATWQCMAPFGRFVEIGKRDIMNNMNLEMARFEHSVSFAAVDLGDLVNYRRPLLQKVFLEVMDLFRSRRIKPVSPVHEFPVSDVESAFRTLQSGKLLGKLVIVPRPDDMVMVSPDIFGVIGVSHRLTAIPGLSSFTRTCSFQG